MITKGIIKRIPANNLTSPEYKFDIRIPIFEEAGSTTEFILKSCLCCNKEEAYLYNVGDVVYVSFEDNDLDRPIILGKLFCEKNEFITKEDTNYIDPRNIKELNIKVANLEEIIEEGGGGGGIGPQDVPENQTTISFILDYLTNINGRTLSAYTATETTIYTYPAVIIKRDDANLTQEQAASFLKGLCGSKYVPTYDYNYPKNSYIIRASDSLILKPQWDSTNGLVLFKMKRAIEPGLPTVRVTSLSKKLADESADPSFNIGETMYLNVVLTDGILNAGDEICICERSKSKENPNDEKGTSGRIRYRYRVVKKYTVTAQDIDSNKRIFAIPITNGDEDIYVFSHNNSLGDKPVTRFVRVRRKLENNKAIFSNIVTIMFTYSRAHTKLTMI